MYFFLCSFCKSGNFQRGFCFSGFLGPKTERPDENGTVCYYSLLYSTWRQESNALMFTVYSNLENNPRIR